MVVRCHLVSLLVACEDAPICCRARCDVCVFAFCVVEEIEVVYAEFCSFLVASWEQFVVFVYSRLVCDAVLREHDSCCCSWFLQKGRNAVWAVAPFSARFQRL